MKKVKTTEADPQEKAHQLLQSSRNSPLLSQQFGKFVLSEKKSGQAEIEV